MRTPPLRAPWGRRSGVRGGAPRSKCQLHVAQRFAMGRVKEAEAADAVKALGGHVLKEPADKLLGMSLPVFFRRILTRSRWTAHSAASSPWRASTG